MMKKLIPFLFVFLWSTGFIGAKYGLPYAASGDFLLVRTLANIAVFLAIIILLKKPRLSFSQIKHAMVAGVLIHGAYLSGVFSAIEHGLPAGLTAIIVGLQPLFTAVISVLLLRKSMNTLQWLALGLGLFGLVLVVFGGIDFSLVTYWALGFAIIALIGITVGTLYQKTFCQNQSLLTSVFWQYVASLLVFLPMSLYQESAVINWQPELIYSLLWLVFALSVAAILLLLYMIEQGDAAKVTAYFYLVPPSAALEAWWLFDESLSQITILGMVLCVLSVFIVIRKAQIKS